MIDTLRLRLHAIFETKPANDAIIPVLDGARQLKSKLKVVYVAPSHQDLYCKMMEYEGSYYETITYQDNRKYKDSEQETSDFLHDEFSKNKGHYLNKKQMVIKSEKEVIKRNMRTMGKARLTSSESDIIFAINHERGYIDFEFSLPKYLYHHNIAQFVPQSHSKFYIGSNVLLLDTWEFQISILHKRLMYYINKFFEDIETMFSLVQPVDLKYVELMRIDLCFNQYFDTKSDALKYLEMIKNINNKYNRTSYQSTKPYDTSISFKSISKAFFKVYHKGSEYETVGDMKKHIKLNREHVENLYDNIFKNKLDEYGEPILNPLLEYTKEFNHIDKTLAESHFDEPKSVPDNLNKKALTNLDLIYQKHQVFDVKYLKADADKILRYELTIRPAYMSYIAKNKFFRKDCKYFQQYKSIYKYVTSVQDSRNTVKSQRTIGKYESAIYNDYRKWIQRTASFVLKSPNLLDTFNTRSVHPVVGDFYPELEEYTIGRNKFYQHSTELNRMDLFTFSDDFLQYIGNEFHKIFKHFQIEDLEDSDNFIQRLQNYNDKAVENVNEYNRLYAYKAKDHNGNPKIIGGRVIKKPSQMLTQKQLRQMHFKKVSITILSRIYDLLNNEGMSLHKIRNELRISSSQFSRYKTDLKLFGISEQSQVNKHKIEPVNDFSVYYINQRSLEHRNSFFSNPNHLMYA